jgi:hypothetical protein
MASPHLVQEVVHRLIKDGFNAAQTLTTPSVELQHLPLHTCAFPCAGLVPH